MMAGPDGSRSEMRSILTGTVSVQPLATLTGEFASHNVSPDCSSRTRRVPSAVSGRSFTT